MSFDDMATVRINAFRPRAQYFNILAQTPDHAKENRWRASHTKPLLLDSIEIDDHVYIFDFDSAEKILVHLTPITLSNFASIG